MLVVSSLANGCVWPLNRLNRKKTRRVSFGITGQETPCQIPRNLSTTHRLTVFLSLRQLQKSPAAPLNLPALPNAPIDTPLHHHQLNLKTNPSSIQQAWVLVTVLLILTIQYRVVATISRGLAHDAKHPQQRMVTVPATAPSMESHLVPRPRRMRLVRPPWRHRPNTNLL